jgi:hypothetical protein
MKTALVSAVTALGLFSAASAVQAGQFKNVQTNSLASGACVTMHSSPQNQGPVSGAAMGIETFEFLPPANGNYRCCANQNTTGQKLFVRLMDLTSGPASSMQSATINGNACTGYVNLTAGYAYQCTVATDFNAPVTPTAHYAFKVCRQ